ncbi:MAG TPA: hypothetical protein VIL13_12185 [Longimicrobiales bacterium]
MDTAVALVNAYLHLNGYVSIPEQPILVGEGRPYRYHTATDVDLIAVRFPNAAVVVPRGGSGERSEAEDLQLPTDELLCLRDDTVDVIIGEVKEGRPRLNQALRDPNVLYVSLRRVDPGFDEPIGKTIDRLIQRGEAVAAAGGRRWRFRLVAFGDGDPIREGGPFTVIPLRHVVLFLMRAMAEHRKVWNDAQFRDPVLDVLHLLDKLGVLRVRDEAADAPMPAD